MQRLAGFEVEDVGFRGPTSLVEAIYYSIILPYIIIYKESEDQGQTG